MTLTAPSSPVWSDMRVSKRLKIISGWNMKAFSRSLIRRSNSHCTIQSKSSWNNLPLHEWWLNPNRPLVLLEKNAIRGSLCSQVPKGLDASGDWIIDRKHSLNPRRLELHRRSGRRDCQRRRCSYWRIYISDTSRTLEIKSKPILLQSRVARGEAN